jgi:hypothetical protein
VLVQTCPARKAEIASLAKPMSVERRVSLLEKLAPCGKPAPLYHQTLGSAYFSHDQFANAEASFRRALSLEVTEAGQVGLLATLARQSDLDQAQRAAVREHVAYFRAHPCDRDDICAMLSYAAWHLDETAVARTAADRAIALEFPGWQPYLFGGIAYATPPAADRAKARRLLVEAKKRGAPAKYVDPFLQKLAVQ